eukprot:3540211-Rhodomonas_salina.1
MRYASTSIRYASTNIRWLSTAHRIAPYAISVLHMTAHPTLWQYLATGPARAQAGLGLLPAPASTIRKVRQHHTLAQYRHHSLAQ